MFSMDELFYILRILLAGVCGICVGIERKNRSKEAGVRTHFVVACGAALIMIISKYAFFDVIQSGAYDGVEVRLDPSRVASTIASGIGFLGAGIIFVHKHNITGLTTAAGIWATSGIGMAIGAGMYGVGIATTLIILLAQYVLHYDFHKRDTSDTKVLKIVGVNEPNYQQVIAQKFSELNIKITDVSIESADGEKNFTIKIELPEEVTEEEVVDIAGYKSSLKG